MAGKRRAVPRPVATRQRVSTSSHPGKIIASTIGEDIGAVVQALGVRALRIGATIDPGVPWTQTLNGGPLLLALKSGNFGGPDF